MHFHALPPARRSSQANPCTSSWIRAIPSFHLPCNPFPLLSLGTNISQHIHSLALTLDLCSLEAKSWGCFSLGARAAYEQSWTWLHLQRMNSKNVAYQNMLLRKAQNRRTGVGGWCGSSSSPFFLNLVRNSCRDASHLPRYRVYYVYYAATLTKHQFKNCHRWSLQF